MFISMSYEAASFVEHRAHAAFKLFQALVNKIKSGHSRPDTAEAQSIQQSTHGFLERKATSASARSVLNITRNNPELCREDMCEGEKPDPGTGESSCDGPKHNFRLSRIEHEGTVLPAVVLTKQLLPDLIRCNHGARVFTKLEPLLLGLVKSLKEEFTSIDKTMLDMEKTLHGQFDQQHDDLKWQRSKVSDRLHAARSLRTTFAEEEIYEPNTRYENVIARQLIREGLMVGELPQVSTGDVDRMLEEFIAAQEALSWPTGEDGGTTTSADGNSGDELLQQDLVKARQACLASREDRTGRLAEATAKAQAATVKAAGLRYPPSEVIQSHALIERTAAIHSIKETDRVYKKLKRRMRRRGIKIEPELSDDTECSFDVDADDEGPDRKLQSGYKEQLRRSEQWQQALPRPSKFVEASEASSDTRSLADSQLPSLSLRSGMSSHLREDSRWIKRSEMWANLQSDRNKASLLGRERIVVPKRKGRVMRRELNNILAQRPPHFRLTNNEPRHRKTAPKSSQGTSDSISHGDFEFWDREHDPDLGEAGQRGNVGSTLVESGRDRELKSRDDSRKRAAQDGLQSPSKRGRT